MEFLKLEDLTVEQKIGMVLCARRFREDDVEFILELVKNVPSVPFRLPPGDPKSLKRSRTPQIIPFSS